MRKASSGNRSPVLPGCDSRRGKTWIRGLGQFNTLKGYMTLSPIRGEGHTEERTVLMRKRQQADI